MSYQSLQKAESISNITGHRNIVLPGTFVITVYNNLNKGDF